MTRTLPPDADHMNDGRAAWAAQAVNTFRRKTGTDEEDPRQPLRQVIDL